MKRSRALTTFAGLTVLGAALTLWAWPERTPTATAVPQALRVEVTVAQPFSGEREVRFAGVTRAADRAQLSFTIAARLDRRPVNVGATVRAGETIAELDAREVRHAAAAAAASLAELEARLDQLERDRRRVQQLLEVEAATAEELEHVSTQRLALEAARDGARVQLAEARRLEVESVLTAPFDGAVTTVWREPGEWVAAGQPVVELAGSGEREVEIQLPEGLVGALEATHGLEVVLPFTGVRVPGQITSVGRAAAGPGRLFPVLVTLDAGHDVAAGQTAEVLLKVPVDAEVAVPMRAVLDPGASQPAVFRVVGDRVERVAVALGPMHGERIAVSGAIEPGDRIVVAGHTRLADGDLVEVR